MSSEAVETESAVRGVFARFAQTSGIPNLILCNEGVDEDLWIVRQQNSDSSQSDIFGSRLRGSDEMWATLHFAHMVNTHDQSLVRS